MENPVARLPCCHYFCQDCVTESVRHSAKCPVCKTKATRRDIAEDPTMDRVVEAFRNLQDHKNDLVAGVGAADAPAIPWLQGVDDEDFRSLSRSLSGTALENMRVDKRGRSKSPVTVHKPSTAATAAAATAAATEVDTAITNAKKHTKNRRSRKRSDASASQGIQKFLKKDATGNKTPAPFTTTTGEDAAAQDVEIADEGVAESPTMSASLMLGKAGGAAARQLDDIVAGLDSDEPTPSEQQGLPAPAPVAAFDANGVNSGKENRRNSARRANVRNKTASTAADAVVISKEEQEEEAPDSNGRRRIPTRLVPWNCSLCTFENKGGEVKCQMCQTAKGAETPPPAQQNFPAVAEASPSAAEGHLATTTHGKTAANRSSKKRTSAAAAAATNANESSAAAVSKKQQQQRKMTAVKRTGAQGRRTTTAKKETNNLLAAVTTSEDTNVKGWNGGVASTKWVLLGSGLDSLGKEQLRLLGALSGATIADKWNPHVTHVICGVGGANAAYPGEKTARRTFKYLMGVLHGRWVLTQEWVNATLSTKKKVDEGAYQVEKDGVGCACGAAVSRAAAITGCNGNKNATASHLLLRGFEVQLQGEFANKAQMIELVKAAGGKVVSRLPTSGANTSIAAAKKKSKEVAEVGGVVLVEVPDTSEAVAAGFKAAIEEQTWFAKAVETGVPVASHRWLTDSISTFQVNPLDQFLIGS